MDLTQLVPLKEASLDIWGSVTETNPNHVEFIPFFQPKTEKDPVSETLCILNIHHTVDNVQYNTCTVNRSLSEAFRELR